MSGVKKKSQKQEKNIAKKTGGNTVVASGAFWHAKGDVRTDKFLIEAKTTDKAYYTLNVKTWEKIEKEAIADGFRHPLMVIDLLGGEVSLMIYDPCIFKLKGEWIDVHHRYQKSIRIHEDLVGCFENGFVTKYIIRLEGTHKYKLCVAPFDLFMSLEEYV